MKRRRWMFSNRLFLINALAFVVAVYAFASLASWYALRLQVSRQLAKGREALLTLFDYYDRKHDDFLEIIFPLYDDRDNYDVLSRLLESPSDDALIGDPFFRARAMNMMRWLAVRDGDIVAILLYKSATGARFAFDTRYMTFEPEPESYPFFAQLQGKPPGRVVYSSRSLGIGSNARLVYGIAGTLGTRSIRRDAGHIMVAYDAAALTRVLERFEGYTEGQYLLLDEGGGVIFDSTGQYTQATYPHLEALAGSTPERPVTIDGLGCYAQTVRQPGRSSIGALLLPRAGVERRAAAGSITIFAICTAFALLSAGLYLMAGLLVSRRVGELERAMERIGSNNLAYRIPLRGHDDEYQYIAQRFNRMCSELEDNIHRLYVYELKQKSAELASLQARINPHFLYNTLETIRARVAEDCGSAASDMIVLLARILRDSVKSEPFVTLREELDTCRMYLSLMYRRSQDTLGITFDVEDQLLECGSIRNLLQPVVENYFIHGHLNDRTDGRVTIRAGRSGELVVITVEDNGVGMDADRLAAVRQRLQPSAVGSAASVSGLANVHERIRIVFGDPCGLSIDSEPGRGTRVTITIRAKSCEELRRMMDRNRSPGDAVS